MAPRHKSVETKFMEARESALRALGGLDRRTFLKGLATAGAAVTVSSRISWADGEIGYWAKDLSSEKLADMYSTMMACRAYVYAVGQACDRANTPEAVRALRKRLRSVRIGSKAMSPSPSAEQIPGRRRTIFSWPRLARARR